MDSTPNADTDPDSLLVTLGANASERELRRWCCACVRRVWGHVGTEGRRAVEVAERYADDSATRDELSRAQRDAEHAVKSVSEWGARNAARAAAWCASPAIDALGVARSVAWGAAYAVGDPNRASDGARLAGERAAQATLLLQYLGRLDEDPPSA